MLCLILKKQMKDKDEYIILSSSKKKVISKLILIN